MSSLTHDGLRSAYSIAVTLTNGARVAVERERWPSGGPGGRRHFALTPATNIVVAALWRSEWSVLPLTQGRPLQCDRKVLAQAVAS
jgi:hypothetical protein